MPTASFAAAAVHATRRTPPARVPPASTHALGASSGEFVVLRPCGHVRHLGRVQADDHAELGCIFEAGEIPRFLELIRWLMIVQRVVFREYFGGILARLAKNLRARLDPESRYADPGEHQLVGTVVAALLG